MNQVAAQSNGSLTYTEEEKKKQAALAKQVAQEAQNATTTNTYTPTVVTNDYSEFLKDFHKEQENAAIADIENAYNKNVATVDRAAASIPKQYESARNQAAGAAAQAQRNADVHAAAVGLGSGTGAQARIANNISLQRNLNEVNNAEAEAKANIELQRSQLSSDYNNAIAQAKANGNAALAEALYAEYIRAEQALISQNQFNAQIGFQQQQHADALKQQAIENAYREAIRQDSLDQFMKEYDLAFEQWQKQKEQQQLDNTYRENARKDALDQFNKEYQLAFDKWQAQLSQQDKDNIYRDQAYKDAMAQQAWENAFDAWQLGYTGNYTYDGNGYKPVVESDSDTELLKEMFNAILQNGSYTPNVPTNTGTTIVNPNQQGNQGTQGQGIDITTIPKPNTTPTLTDPNKLGASINNAVQNTVTNNGGVYQVGSDGKAPKGLSVGDQVVTAGGTYEITAVNADGSYQSKLVDKSQTTDNYGGSYDKAPAQTTATELPFDGFDYELWGSKDEYYENLGRTNLAENLVADLKNQTEQVRLDNLMHYANTGKLDTAEFGYVLSRLGYNPDEWIDW